LVDKRVHLKAVQKVVSMVEWMVVPRVASMVVMLVDEKVEW
jgi:hypothetical protein